MTADDDLDGTFFDLIGTLDEIELDDVMDVTELSTMDLTRRMTFLRTELISRGQYIHPTDGPCREMHSELAACKIEMARRANDNRT
jgi:hypothetical protein